MRGSRVAYNGPGFLALLTIAFIVLKLCSVITWGWFWVLSPILIPLLVSVVILIPFGIVLLVKMVKRK